MSKKIGLVSLGCAKNLVNSEQMLYLLDEAGFEITGETENVDAVIVNTCGFIESAKMEAIDTILELAQGKCQGKIGKIIVTGCLSQRYRDELLQEMPEIDAIVGVGSFDQIVSVVNRTLNHETVSAFSDIHHTNEEIGRVNTTSPAWAYIKIAEGCDNCCAYCVIPRIRGRFRSRPLENVVAEAERMANDGIKELIVVAQDITRYGKDLYGKSALPELLRRLCAIEGFAWIRLHYLYPDEITDELIDVIAENDKILKYLDIPLQHIDDHILKTMCRRGDSGQIRALLDRLRRRIPGLVLRTSLITGLPGEGEAEFEELCEFVREAKIQRTGVFAFSPEEGTPAYHMDFVDEETAQRRAELIMDIQSEIMDDYNASRIGTVEKVLVEGFDGIYYYGRSYAESPDIDGRILFRAEDAPINDFVTVRITDCEDGEPIGERIDDP